MNKFRMQIRTGLLVFLCFLWTGSAYITWLYRLTDVFGNTTADWLSEGVGYIFQAAGILLYALLMKHRPALAKTPHTFAGILLADGVMIAASTLTGSKATVLVFGLAMNLLHGIVAGIYLTWLAMYVPQRYRGIVFGIAYGMASIGSWLLSLPMEQSFLRTQYCLGVYAALIAFTVWWVYRPQNNPETPTETEALSLSARDSLLLASVVVLLSLVKGLGFYFPMAESMGGSISLEFSRAFYAIGLVIAGVVGDKKRRYGAICCLAALVLPFITTAVRNIPNASIWTWILSYVFFGFFAVYRVVVYCDIAAQKGNLLWMAGFGLLFGRIGDAVSAVGGFLLTQQDMVLVALTAVLFAGTVFLFFSLYHKLYMPAPRPTQTEERQLAHFEGQYGLSNRECEIFRLVIKGRSNGEIGGALFITENTVKFHVKNVLKKTECSNRTELISKYREATIR